MIPKSAIRETVLYYTPENGKNVAKLKGVLVRMGIRIKNVAPDQVGEKVGVLAGLTAGEDDAVSTDKKGSMDREDGNGGRDGKNDGSAENEANAGGPPHIPEEILVMHNFSGRRMDELLMNLRKAGVPKINLKAVITDTNRSWTFYHLYEELREEHERMEGASK